MTFFLPLFRNVVVKVANEHGSGGTCHQVTVVRNCIDVDDHGAMPVVTYDSYSGCPFPRVDVFYEIHVEGKCHYTFADGGAGDAQRDVR